MFVCEVTVSINVNVSAVLTERTKRIKKLKMVFYFLMSDNLQSRNNKVQNVLRR